jgi:hypothetical protein
MGDLPGLFADEGRFEALQARLHYLWMLIGDHDLVKPDRMVLRWLTRHSRTPVDPATARQLLPAVAQIVGCTPWELDHAIWRAESGRAPLPTARRETR